jgi:hypothetical protein
MNGALSSPEDCRIPGVLTRHFVIGRFDGLPESDKDQTGQGLRA